MHKALLPLLLVVFLAVSCSASTDESGQAAADPATTPTTSPSLANRPGTNSIEGLPDELAMLEDRAPDGRSLSPDEVGADPLDDLVAEDISAGSCTSSLDDTILELIRFTGDPDAAESWDDDMSQIAERADAGDFDGAEEIACRVGREMEALLAGQA